MTGPSAAELHANAAAHLERATGHMTRARRLVALNLLVAGVQIGIGLGVVWNVCSP